MPLYTLIFSKVAGNESASALQLAVLGAFSPAIRFRSSLYGIEPIFNLSETEKTEVLKN